jgi:hypothetical protein
MLLHWPEVGGSGHCAFDVHAEVQMFCIMIIWQEL